MKRAISIIISLALLLTACAAGAESGEKLSIVVTDFPCYDFARAVAGDNAEITMLIKPGSEVHSYEPAPGDVVAMMEADLFIYIGGESDSWVEDMLASMDGDAPETLRMFDHVDTLCGEDDDHKEHDHDGHEHEYDEHIWTSPLNAMDMVNAVSVALGRIDPENADVYAANADAYTSQIAEIDVAIRELADGAERNTLVFADRFPFLYMATEYGFDYAAAFPGCAGETEPSASVVMELIDRVISEDIPAIYVIEMSTGNVADTIAESTGAEVLTLHSMQNVSADEFAAGETYVSLMWKNVDALKKGLN